MQFHSETELELCEHVFNVDSGVDVETSSSAIAERCTAGWVSSGQKWKTGTGTQYFADITDLSSNTVR